MSTEGVALVNEVLRGMRRSLLLYRADVDFEDYQQVGFVGYIKAKENFDPSKGQLVPYAKRRIAGEIIDYNRSLGSRFERNRPTIHYINDLVGFDWSDMKTPNAEEVLARKENVEWIFQLLSKLRESHRQAVVHYYFEDKNMKEIGNLYGLTEARIGQILGGALRNLQELMKGEKMPPKGWKRDPTTGRWRAPDLAHPDGANQCFDPVDVDEVLDKSTATDISKMVEELVVPAKKEKPRVDSAKQEVELVVRLKIVVEVEHK